MNMESIKIYQEIQPLIEQVREAEFLNKVSPSLENRRNYYTLWVMLYDKYTEFKSLELDEFMEGFEYYISNKDE